MSLNPTRLTVKQSYKELGKDKSSAKYTSAENQNLKLLQKYSLWQSKQLMFMPGMPNWEPVGEIDEEEVPESWNLVLGLPSSVPVRECSDICIPHLADEEYMIREESAYVALENLRKFILQERVKMKNQRLHNSGPSQKTTTRSYDMIDAIRDQIQHHAKTYRRMWDALTRLDPNREWDSALYELRDENLVAPFQMTSLSRSKRPVSNSASENVPDRFWIWGIHGAAIMKDIDADSTNEAQKVDPALRVEWAKPKARRDRWNEEVILVNEEMRRVLAYFGWKANWWLELALNFSHGKSAEDDGAIAYSNKQANNLKNLAATFREMWMPYAAEGTLPIIQSLNQVCLIAEE